MIRAFLFDYDGVITAGVKDKVPATRLANMLGVSVDQASEWILSVWDEFSTGKLTEHAAWDKIEQQYGKQIATAQRDIWYTWEELRPLPAMVKLVQDVRAKGYPVGVVSNVLPVTAQLIRKHHGYDTFDFAILSCEAGARKPNPLIFEVALLRLAGIKPEEIMFLDDREDCITGASEFGLQTMHVTDQSIAAAQVYDLL